MIPEDILKDIVRRAKKNWRDDKEMQKDCIREEKEAYENLQKLDFGELSHLKPDVISMAKEIFISWDERLRWVNSELAAYREILTFDVKNLDYEIIEAWKEQAKVENENLYQDQLEFLKEKAKRHAYALETRKHIDPIKKLLIELEEIIGNECYNGNIKNYESWGRLESEGRKFRYPVKFYTDNGEYKKWSVPSSIPSEELITGYYAFGANELNIYRALFKIVTHLKEKYGLAI